MGNHDIGGFHLRETTRNGKLDLVRGAVKNPRMKFQVFELIGILFFHKCTRSDWQLPTLYYYIIAVTPRCQSVEEDYISRLWTSSA